MTSPATSSDRNDATAHPDGSAWLARLEREGATLGDALALIDAMPAVAVSEIMGRWRGSELPTGHPLDGWLLAVGWWGKEFSSPEHVHPLLFTNGKDHVFPASARAFPFRPLMAFVMNNKLRPNRLVCSIVRAALPLFRTQRPMARLCAVETRGVPTATMVYDWLPIHDAFRRIDAETLLGMMEMRGMEQPFFFVLRRV